MKIKELRALDDAGKTKELESLLREQFNLRMQHATGQLGNTGNLKKVRRNIAQLRTVMNEKQSKS